VKKTAKRAAPPQVVTDVELLALETSRAALALLRKHVKDSEARLDGLEADLIARLDAGAVISGDVVAVVDVVEGQCRPKWKEQLLAHMEKYHQVSPQTCEAQMRALTPVSSHKVLNIIERKS
jgi:hypothetical protein